MGKKTEDVVAEATDHGLDQHASNAADHGLDPKDPAVTGVGRDERHDSIDPATGLLTEEAVALRAAKPE